MLCITQGTQSGEITTGSRSGWRRNFPLGVLIIVKVYSCIHLKFIRGIRLYSHFIGIIYFFFVDGNCTSIICPSSEESARLKASGVLRINQRIIRHSPIYTEVARPVTIKRRAHSLDISQQHKNPFSSDISSVIKLLIFIGITERAIYINAIRNIISGLTINSPG